MPGTFPLALNLADLRFAEVKGFGYLDFELPANAARGPSHRLYEGPEWDLGLGVNGSVKAELKGGLGEVLDAVGIGSPFNLSLELFDVRNELLSSPKVRISATPGLAALEDQISVLVTTDGNHSGRFDLWSSSDGANELESLGSGEIKRGQGTQAIQGETLGEGDHRILPRLTVDAVSSVLPYATGVGADVSVGSGGSDPPETITLTLPGGVPLEMVYLPPGTFTMGSPRDERGRLYDSEDLHEVTLTRGYYLGRYEITIRQWEAVMGLDPCGFAGCEYLDYPVIWVSWNDVCGGTTGSDCAADSFIGKLNAYLGTTKFRLPTEAEWERAARAGTETPFSFGDDESCDLIDCSYCHLFDDYMVWCGNAGEMPYWPGVKLPNGFGLYDMHGNVFEWTADWFTQHLGTAPVTDPINLDEGEWQEKVMRGGAWTFPAHFCRSAMRVSYTPDGISRDVGFRLAKSP